MAEFPELDQYFVTQPSQEQGKYQEWKLLFDLANNPPPQDISIGAIVVPTGSWLERVHPAVDFFKKRFVSQEEPPKLVITGANGDQALLPYTSGDAEKITRAIRMFGHLSEAMKKQIIPEVTATNTKEQAVNVYNLLKQGSLKEPLVLFVSDFHLPRNYSTFVQQVIANEGVDTFQTRIYSVPVSGDWSSGWRHDEETPRRSYVVSELDRIHKYREKGDVVSQVDLERYNLRLHSAEEG